MKVRIRVRVRVKVRVGSRVTVVWGEHQGGVVGVITR